MSLYQMGLGKRAGLAILCALILVGCAGSQKIAPHNKIDALREAYEPLPKVYDALLEARVITPKQYNDVIVPADKVLYMGIQGAWIAVDSTGATDLSAYKKKIIEALNLLDEIKHDQLQMYTAVIRALVEGL